MNLQITSKKRVQIDRVQSSMLLTVAIATVAVVFCLVSTKALFSQAAYQRRVINARNVATKQIKENINKANTLVDQYANVFQDPNATNAIGGINDSSPDAVPPDIDNGRLVLDALPTTYDFPALLTSIQKVLINNGIGAPSIGGSDQSSETSSTPIPNPQPTSIELSITGTATYQGVQSLIKDLERSIRPFDITKITLSGNEANMVVTLKIITYYQPAKSLLVDSKEIR